jgi:Phytanoyl-CoA dioxygenase (PhyH)
MDLGRLRRDGYAVVPGAIDAAHVGRLLDAVREVEGLDLDRPETWAGVPERVPMGGHQAQWDVRQHPALHAAFAAAYGDERLAVSQDRVGVKPPGSQAMGIHLDVDPDAGPRVYGGLVYLTDAPAEAGAFCCVPGLLGSRAAWEEEPVDLGDHAVVPVPGRAGDLVLWDVRLPHGNLANRSRSPRVVQYVSLFPHGAWGDRPQDHQALWRSGRDWADELGPADHRPAALTALGRRLIGLQAYG